ncbi:hypothetical protein QJS10_CPA03g00700 [Acorus calamus]|uniref:Uncharacterized protein n=1 Tax=Acorus calamus TaxID=4465 RepID=A0AAV9F3D2_ACOCL|nr:hypothetical protein QJS10_CPA03g00700 [Acorus calamus]
MTCDVVSEPSITDQCLDLIQEAPTLVGNVNINIVKTKIWCKETIKGCFGSLSLEECSLLPHPPSFFEPNVVGFFDPFKLSHGNKARGLERGENCALFKNSGFLSQDYIQLGDLVVKDQFFWFSPTTNYNCRLAWKEIVLGGRNAKLRTMEAFSIILSATQLLYVLVIHAAPPIMFHAGQPARR